jgi:hypothetical protein
MTPARRKLPIGIQTFREIREDDCYYVDKTGFIRQLIEEGKYYFLSRPRRFGKSLLIDTIAEVFAGNEPLFRELAIHPHWDWSVRHPVIRLSFGGGVVRSREELDLRIGELLDGIDRRLGLATGAPSHPGRLARMIEELRSLRRNCRGWIATRSAAGITATTGPASPFTTPLICCCCFRNATLRPSGSRPARRPS